MTNKNTYKLHALNKGLCKAYYGGYINIVEFLLDKGANYYTGGLHNACLSGNQEIINIMSCYVEIEYKKWKYEYCNVINELFIKDVANLLIEY